MSTNTSRSDKSDGTDLSNSDFEQPVIDQLKAAIRGPDAKCGNGPAAVIAYAERQTTADFLEAADALERMIDRGDVVRIDGRLELVETDGGVPEGDADELDRRARAAARALLRYAQATGQRPEWLLAFERHRERDDSSQIITDGGEIDPELSGGNRLSAVRGSAHVEGVTEVFEDSFADHELSVGTGYSDAGAFLNLVYEDGDVEIDLGAVLTPEGARALATALEVLAETAEER